ncbi:MAG: anthrone oxygenase family protein [Pseudomonadota bacterium]
MPTDPLVYFCLVAGLSSALVAGVFQSFSDFVMQGLTAARPASGAEAMRMINRTVFRSAFLAMFLALVPASLMLAGYAWFTMSGAAQSWIVAGAMTYLPSVFLVTILGNVPRNEQLDRLDPHAPETERYWRRYGIEWTRLNHVRTVGSVVTGACFLMAALALSTA